MFGGGSWDVERPHSTDSWVKDLNTCTKYLSRGKELSEGLSSACSAVLTGKAFTERVQMLLLGELCGTRAGNMSVSACRGGGQSSCMLHTRGHSRKLGFVFSAYLK